MLSDSCGNFLDAMYDDGVTPEMYKELRDAIRHYQKKPFNYPRKVCEFLVAAIDAIQKPDPKIGNYVFIRLLIATFEAYWDPSGKKEAKLPKTLCEIWPGGPLKLALKI